MKTHVCPSGLFGVLPSSYGGGCALPELMPGLKTGVSEVRGRRKENMKCVRAQGLTSVYLVKNSQEGRKWTCLGFRLVGSHGHVTPILRRILAGEVLSNET